MSNTRRHEKKFHRNDGTVIRLIANWMPNPIGVSATDFFAFVKGPQDTDERMVFMPRFTSNSLGGLSVEEYKNSGEEVRGLLALLSPGEILKAGMELQEKLRA